MAFTLEIFLRIKIHPHKFYRDRLRRLSVYTREIRRKNSFLSMLTFAKNSFSSTNELPSVSSGCFHFFVMFKTGKYLSAISRRKIMKNLSWKDEEIALLQPVIDYTVISCLVSAKAAVGMAAT